MTDKTINRHIACGDCDGFLYDYCEECPINKKETERRSDD